jgi:nicotinamide riboside transporter PnuC
MFPIKEICSALANGTIMVATYYQVKGKWHIAFPLYLVSSVLFLIYGIIQNDYSFIILNAVYFIPMNIIGVLKWRRNARLYDNLNEEP